MFEGCFAAKSLFYVDTHELADEFLGFIADIVPVGRVELKFSCKIENGGISLKTEDQRNSNI